MKTTSTSPQPAKISVQKVASLVQELLGGGSGREDPNNPTPPGPWDPYIRRAVERVSLRFGPQPDPWRVSVSDRISHAAELAALNPQPLPPRATLTAALAQEVSDRAELMQEMADAIQTGQQQGIIIVGGHLSKFVDFVCGNGLRRRFPVPPPKGVDEDRLSALELLVMGAVFERNSQAAASDGLRQELRNASARLTEEGLARM
jgi:hypothetical protein